MGTVEQDAFVAETAIKNKIPLATDDKALRAVAMKTGANTICRVYARMNDSHGSQL